MSKCSLCVVPAGIIIIQKDIPIVAVCFDQLEFFRKEPAGISFVEIVHVDRVVTASRSFGINTVAELDIGKRADEGFLDLMVKMTMQLFVLEKKLVDPVTEWIIKLEKKTA